jgi:flagellar FliJ protein
MMKNVLPLLIERAQQLRDKHVGEARDTLATLQTAQQVLQRLDEFRAEFLARSPAASGATADAQALLDYQRFVGRLDEAMAQQRQECARRQQRNDAAQRQLLESQRRVVALQAWQRREAAALAAKDNRRTQREADEFAARAAGRYTGEALL